MPIPGWWLATLTANSATVAASGDQGWRLMVARPNLTGAVLDLPAASPALRQGPRQPLNGMMEWETFEAAPTQLMICRQDGPKNHVLSLPRQRRNVMRRPPRATPERLPGTMTVKPSDQWSPAGAYRCRGKEVPPLAFAGRFASRSSG
jgi:hypothetical protein